MRTLTQVLRILQPLYLLSSTEKSAKNHSRERRFFLSKRRFHAKLSYLTISHCTKRNELCFCVFDFLIHTSLIQAGRISLSMMVLGLFWDCLRVRLWNTRKEFLIRVTINIIWPFPGSVVLCSEHHFFCIYSNKAILEVYSFRREIMQNRQYYIVKKLSVILKN